jgi:hypothetical protein
MRCNTNRLINPFKKPGIPNPSQIFPSGGIFWGNGSNVTLNASAVSSVTNLFGGTNMTQGTALSQPTYTANGLNNFPILNFDTIIKGINGNINITSGVIYIAMVFRPVDYSVYGFGRVAGVRAPPGSDYADPNGCSLILRNNVSSQLSGFYNNAGPIAPFAVTQGTWFTVEMYYDFTNLLLTPYLNTVAQSTGALNNNSIASTYMFYGQSAGADSTFLHDWAEVIVTSSATAAQRIKVQNYLRAKYAHY